MPELSVERLEQAEKTLREQAVFVDSKLAELYILTANHLKIDRKQTILIAKYIDLAQEVLS